MGFRASFLRALLAGLPSFWTLTPSSPSLPFVPSFLLSWCPLPYWWHSHWTQVPKLPMEDAGLWAAEHMQSGKLPPWLPPGWCLARELHFLRCDWPPAGPWATLCYWAYWQSWQILSGAWGGDRDASISNLIPHAWWKEPILSQQRLTSCYIDFYINNKGQPVPQRARMGRGDEHLHFPLGLQFVNILGLKFLLRHAWQSCL